MGDYKIGQTVQLGDERQGIIRWLGTGSFSPGQWIGLELPDGSGKNDGSVKGERYFQCAPGHGMMIRPEAVVAILKQPAFSMKPKPTNGTSTKPRPSSGITPDVARKRQSLMSSPTKSPTKAAVSSASSNASTPRTGTPATTARTSDSSTKSRLSTTARPSMGPPATVKPAPRISRQSTEAPVSKATTARSQPRTSTIGTRAPARNVVRPQRAGTNNVTVADEQAAASHIDEEEEEDVRQDSDENPLHIDNSEHHIDVDAALSPKLGAESPMASISRSAAINTSLESRAAALKETEQYKATIRSLENKLQAQRGRIKAVDILQTDKEKLENAMQALQNKLRATLQAKAELQTRCDEVEAKANEFDNRGGEHDSELEMATLDKEMAEERAENFAYELETLKAKHEELELEVEILREENKELGSVMSPEEKATAGWLQMERERDRLRDALGMLRDLTQQRESDLNRQIRELQQDLADSELTAMKHHEATEKLARSEAANKHLMEQLEAVESNEDLNMALEAEREQKQNIIDQIREQLQTLQEEAQVSDELEAYHVATEKELQQEVDESSALLYEKELNIGEQTKIIEDLEYTLSKFRDVVQGLQSDIDDLRRSRDITESEAHEMSSKSRAMMDLNLQLQNSAAKMQLKTIDIELGRMRAEESAEHLSIIQMFVPESYEAEKMPVLTLLCLRRIKSKANLVTSLLRDRIKDRPHLMADDPFSIFDTIERLCSISSCCNRFLHYMGSCNPTDLANFRNAIHELEPVERTVNLWVDSLKRDELSRDGSDMLLGMRGILSDLIEKCIPENTETAASRLSSHTSMVETYCDSTMGELHIILRFVQSKLGPSSPEDEEAMYFQKRMDQFSTRAKTLKYIAGKASQAIEELRLGSMCIEEPAWTMFSDTEVSALGLSQLLRDMGSSLMKLFADEENAANWTYTVVFERMRAAVAAISQLSQERQSQVDDAFGILATKLQELHSQVEQLALKTSDVGSAMEFERQSSPWTIRSREIKAQKVISQDVQEQLRKFKTQAENQAVTISEKDNQLEERQIKIDLLESRTKETKQISDSIQKLKSEVDALRAAKESTELELQQTTQDMQALTRTRQDELAELEALKKARTADGNVVLPGTLGSHDETMVLQLRSEVQFLNTEILSLQAAVRYLKMDNYKLRIPAATASTKSASYAWLSSSLLTGSRGSERAGRLKAESDEVFGGLLDIAKKAKPLALKAENSSSTTSWRATKDTPRYVALQRREELERWVSWKKDLVKRAQLGGREPSKARSSAKRRQKVEAEAGFHAVEIVGSPPR